MLYKSFLIKDTCMQDRLQLLLCAARIASFEYSMLDEDILRNIFGEYLLGEIPLLRLKRKWLEKFPEAPMGKEIKAIMSNKLNIQSKRKFKNVLYLFATLNMMILLTKEITYDYFTYRKVHQYLFGDLIQDGGEERTCALSKRVGNRTKAAAFIAPEDIGSAMEIVEEKMRNMELLLLIDSNGRDIFEGWREMDTFKKSQDMADIISYLYYIHPFSVGCMTLSIFFVMHFAMRNDINIDLECLVELNRLGRKEKKGIKELIALSSDNYEEENDVEALANVLHYAMKRQKEKEQMKERTRESLSVQLRHVKKEVQVEAYDFSED